MLLRLIGKAKHGFPVYAYVGLYRCVEYTHEPSKDGPKVYRFTLKPIEGQTKLHRKAVKREENDGVTNHPVKRNVAAQLPANKTNNTSQPPVAKKLKLKAAKHEESADYPRVAATKPLPPANHVVHKPKPLRLAKLCSVIQVQH